MQQAKVDLFLATMHDKFTPWQRLSVREVLLNMPEDQMVTFQSLPYKDPIVILVVSLFVGGFGIDRFMLGDIGLGILKILTCGGFGIWVIIDWFLVMDKAKKVNYELFMQYAQQIKV